MVAYKKLNKEERRIVCQKMVNKLWEKSDALKLLRDIDKKYESLMRRNIPDEVTAFAKKYPKTIKTSSINLYTRSFLPKENAWCNESCFNWPYINANNVILGFFKDKEMNESFFYNYDKLIEYIKEEDMSLYNKIAEELIPKLQEIEKFAKSLRCALDKIITVNKLKMEIPEAYEIYAQRFGEPAKTEAPCSEKKSDFCDTVEKIRMQYNSKK